MAWRSIPLLLSFASWEAALAANREYCVRAEETSWDSGPSEKDAMTEMPFVGHEDAEVFMVNDPSQKQIGRKYWKCLYVEYLLFA